MADNLIGQTIGRYQIAAKLGSGGMAVVYRAHDTRLDRDVALKLIRTDVTGAMDYNQLVARFEREARTLAKLQHANIVKVLDFGEHQGALYLVMEYLSGGTLQDFVDKPQPLSVDQAVRLLLPVARALAYAHEKGIVHRDVKPANILLTEKGQPMLSDFGLVRFLENAETPGLTATGEGIGTPEYMAPEQWNGESGLATDIYAQGVTLYKLTTGHGPYNANTPGELLAKQLTEPPSSPRLYIPGISAQAERVMLTALAKDVSQRYATMDEFAQALEGLLVSPSLEANLAMVQQAYQKQELPPIPRVKVRPVPLWMWVGVGLTAFMCMGLAGLLGLLAWESNAEKNIVQSTLAVVTPDVGTEKPVRPEAGDMMVADKDGMTLVYVPDGAFKMGSEDGESDEKPVHVVVLDAYWIDRTEVTNAMFAKFVKQTGHKTDAEQEGWGYAYLGKGQGGKIDDANWRHPNGAASGIDGLTEHPVTQVSWNDAKAYCEWAGRKLPTEAQWEKAARGPATGAGDGRKYPWGNQAPAGDLLNYADKNLDADWADKKVDDGYKFTAPVGSYLKGASPYGALDMAGNVWEWTADWYGETYYGQSPRANPTGPVSGDAHVARGGAWNYIENVVRVAYRYRNAPALRSYFLGFRCVRPLPK